MAASRVQKWAILLAAYDFQIKHIKGVNNAVADGLSRITAGIRDANKMTATEDYTFLNYVTNDVRNINNIEISAETGKDPILKTVRNYFNNG